MAKIDELKAFYRNLLIVQYHDKPKAKATIDALVDAMIPVNSATGNLLWDDIRDFFDIETAVGIHLDILGVYIGLSRPYIGQILDGYFALTGYTNTPIGNGKGFTNYSDDPVKAGETLKYDDVVSLANAINDDDYRTLLKLKIAQNSSNNSMKSIDEELYKFFGMDIYVYSEGDMQMTYSISSNLSTIIRVAIDLRIIPKPMGVYINYISH